MATLTSTVLTRWRYRLVEEDVDASDDFYTDTRGLEWFDEGNSLQHERIFDNAIKTGEYLNFLHPYLKKFIKRVTWSTTPAKQDYSMSEIGATDFWKPCVVHFFDVQANRVSFEDDRAIRDFPQMGPAAGQCFWTLTPDQKIRLYVHGKATVPNEVQTAHFDYYRNVLSSPSESIGSPPIEKVDQDDPYLTGPIEYMVGMAMQRERSDWTPFIQKAQVHADMILPPPAQVAE